MNDKSSEGFQSRARSTDIQQNGICFSIRTLNFLRKHQRILHLVYLINPLPHPTTSPSNYAPEMANEQSMPLPLVDERDRKMLDAIHNAPSMSIQIVLLSLYAEGDDNLKTRIEDLVHDYTLTLHNLDAGIATPASDLRTEPAPEVARATEEPIDNTIYCPVCDDYFDPDDEDDICFHHHGKFPLVC